MDLGRTIAQRYRLESRIAAGGMGEVFLARDLTEGRRVAIKVLHPTPHEDDSRRKRFLREAWAVSQLSHPSIVRVFDRGEEHDGCVWIAMEFIDGTSLAAMLDRGPLPLREVVAVLAPVARALGAAHRAGFVHRDVKPENILVRGDGLPVLVDFGITRAIRYHSADDGGVDKLTRTGMLIGTPEYMSPEQVRSQPLDGRSDQFSLALVCYEALTGTRPFAGDAPLQTIAAILTDEVLPLSEVMEGIPPEIDAAIARALSKRPDDRFPRIESLAEVLEEFVPTALTGIQLARVVARRSLPPLRGSPTVIDLESEVVRVDPTTEPSLPEGDRMALLREADTTPRLAPRTAVPVRPTGVDAPAEHDDAPTTAMAVAPGPSASAEAPVAAQKGPALAAEEAPASPVQRTAWAPLQRPPDGMHRGVLVGAFVLTLLGLVAAFVLGR